MRALARALAILSGLLLGAHFLRAGQLVLVAVFVGVPLLLFVRRRWSVRLVQIVLFLGALEWLKTLVLLGSARQAAGEPSLRLVVILSAVTLVTAAASVLVGLEPRRRPLPSAP